MFRGLLTLMVQDWWRPWNCCVLQTDASESGWGMAQSFWPQHVVEQVGRLPERARFRSALGRPARESALAAANLGRGSSGALCSFEKAGSGRPVPEPALCTYSFNTLLPISAQVVFGL